MKKLVFLLLLCLPLSNVNATTLSYDISNIAGDRWEYTYTISNDMLAVDIEEFAVFFDLGLFENIIATATPSGWDPLVFQPDPFFLDDGLYDVLALVSGIASGDSLGGFSVQFDFLGAGTPGSQEFEIIDPFSFSVLGSGQTRNATNNVPEPSGLVLVLFGLLALVFLKQKKCLIEIGV